VLSSLVVAIVLGLVYLAYDVALRRGATLPGGDLRTLYLALDVAIVLVVGSVVTWLVVPQPTGAGTVARRSGWSAALGFFAAVPIALFVLLAAVRTDPTARTASAMAVMMPTSLAYADLVRPDSPTDLPPHSILVEVEDGDTLESVFAAPTCTSTSGLARMLRYQPGCCGAPPFEAITK